MNKPRTPFDEEFLRDGFLANFPPEELARVRSHASDAFDFADRLNKRLMVIMRGLTPRRELTGMRHSLINLLIPMVDLIEPLGEIFKVGFGSEGFKWAVELSALNGAELVEFDFKKHIT